MLGSLALAGSSTAAGATPLGETQVKKALLSLKEINAKSGMIYPSTSSSLVCHTAPYFDSEVRYCYWEYLHSNAAYAAKRGWASHVDIIAFNSQKYAFKYLKEMQDSNKASTLISKTKYSQVYYKTNGAIATPPAAPGGANGSVTGPAAVGFYIKGLNVVYTECSNPDLGASKTELTKCAMNLARAQLAKL
jgi:hypothetical protein